MTNERTCHFTGDDAWKCGTHCTCQHFNWNNKGQAAMTSELRPAVAVAEDCHWEYELKSEEEAAAVIEADREAVRAEQAAELAKFKALAEALASDLRECARALQSLHQIPGTGAEGQAITGHKKAETFAYYRASANRAALADAALSNVVSTFDVQPNKKGDISDA